MDNSEILNKYIDGELSPEAEKNFFFRLAGDDGLHSKLRNITAIRNSIQSNSAAMNPPVESTAAVFSALGFSPPSAGISPLVSSEKGFISRHWQKAVISILTLIIIYLLFPGSGGFSGIDNDSVTPVVSSGTTGNIIQTVPLVSSTETREENIPSKPEIRTVIKYVYVPVEVTPSDKQNNDIPSIIDQDIKHTHFMERTYPAGSAIPEITSRPGYAGMLDLIEIPFRNLGIDLEFRGLQDFHFPSETIYPAKNMMFNNYSLTALYNLGAGFKGGIDIRNENFFQRFRGMDKLGRYITYEQQPNLTSLSLALRYSYGLSDMLSPFATINAGGNRAGMVFRAMGGIEYTPYFNVGFVLGLEYSYLGYSYQSRAYNSNKLGLHYGVNFKL